MRLFSIVFLLALALPSVSMAAQECTVIATVFEKDICEADIAISTATEADVRRYAEKNDQDPDDAVKGLTLSNLFNTIWEAALLEKYGEKALTPSKKEIGTYVAKMNALQEKQRSYDQKIADLVKKLMMEHEYEQEQYKQLNRIGIEAVRNLKFYDTQQKSLTPKIKALQAEQDQKIAYAALKNWRVQKLLFETYGGDIVFQQAGLEPIEAFEDFLDDIQDNEAIVIHERAYKDVYDTFEDYIDDDHIEIPEDAPEVAVYFADPFWALNDTLFDQGFVAVQAQIMAIPFIEKEEQNNDE